MAKKKADKNKHPKRKQNKRLRKNTQAASVIALIVFIFIGLSVIGGTIYYYFYHQPEALTEMERATAGFTQDYFNFNYETITGNEGRQWLSSHWSETALASRVDIIKSREVISQIDDGVTVSVLEQGWNRGRARAEFWFEEVKAEEDPINVLYYVEYDFVRENGEWLISSIDIPTEEDLENFRRSRGVWDEHYGDDDEDEDEDDDEEEETE